MDWYLDGDSPRSFSQLRHEVRSYLVRHGEPGSEFDDAELIFSEVVGNAVRHAGGPIWVSLSWHDVNPILTVRDLGSGFDPDALLLAAREPLGRVDAWDNDSAVEEGSGPAVREADLGDLPEWGRGLFLITHLAPALQAHNREGKGMSVTVTLPVARLPVSSPDPPLTASGALPALSEANPEGGFGRESFLRALVVQLARALELQQGPHVADAAVAQVGVDVGGQMEEEFRLAEHVVGRMTPEQMGHCYVRLKHAIDGGFYVIEVDERKIVLGNRQCPFGDVVRRAPALCQMTSSVFGGIAARNSDHGASVLLEERIAVGDPGCRVVVYLEEPPAAIRPHVHHYSTPTGSR